MGLTYTPYRVTIPRPDAGTQQELGNVRFATHGSVVLRTPYALLALVSFDGT